MGLPVIAETTSLADGTGYSTVANGSVTATTTALDPITHCDTEDVHKESCTGQMCETD